MRNGAPFHGGPKRYRSSGFTLIELMIVVVIIGILAAIAIPRFAESARGAKRAEVGPLMKQIITLQERYQAKEGTFASDITLLEGGATLATSGKYFGFGMSPHATGYCVVATPNAVGTSAGLTAQSMDALGNHYDNGSCS